MSIQEIKSRLSIMWVLNHYGLKTDSNGMLPCPFHDDQKASMKIYLKTNTAYCFAGGCKIKSLDVIDFIMNMESCTKHKAILKAKTLIAGDVSRTKPITPPIKSKTMDKTKTFKRYEKALFNHHQAKAYCESRGLNWQHMELGYKSRRTKDAWGKGCIIFPLKDELGEIINFYGRSIFTDGHYYEKNRQGLYPCYPGLNTQTLLLGESIIDTATLRQLKCVAGFSMLSLFGTNGLNEEHKNAIAAITNLEEIILVLDGDQAGRKATDELTNKLSQMCGQVKISTIHLPDGEDVNSLYVSHLEEAELLFENLFTNRKTLFEPKPSPPINASKLKEVSRYKLQYEGLGGTYHIKGFDPKRYNEANLDMLKITLQITKS